MKWNVLQRNDLNSWSSFPAVTISNHGLKWSTWIKWIKEDSTSMYTIYYIQGVIQGRGALKKCNCEKELWVFSRLKVYCEKINWTFKEYRDWSSRMNSGSKGIIMCQIMHGPLSLQVRKEVAYAGYKYTTSLQEWQKPDGSIGLMRSGSSYLNEKRSWS